ncbi:MAG: ATP-binding cassette domain-containing protein [Rhodocyclaceae bacterium]|nr:ATP-binding cassette domain-containing protein [Rhodocyclaceae bacterium]
MNDLLISAEQLVAGWQGPATAPLDLALPRGKILGLTGPNGVGKSTILSALAGRAKCYAGVLTLRPGLRLAFQTQDIPPLSGLPLSGRELLALTGAREQGLPPWLQERLKLRVDQLSGGQRHYLALWAILQAPADVVLLDEPTNNLDAAGTEHLALALRQRAAEGAGIILVSHDEAFVSGVCDQVQTMRVAPHV